MRRALLVAALVLAGCAGNGPPPAATPTPGPTPGGDGITIDQLEERIFNINCLSGGCHNGGDASGMLVLEPGQSWGELVNVTPDNFKAAEEGLRLVVPFDPEHSLLLIKLTEGAAAYGSRMPLQRPPLTEADIEMVRQWILDGALDRRGPSPTAPPTETLTPTPPPSSTPSETPTSSATSSPSDTPTPTITATFTKTATGTVQPSATPTDTLPPTATPTDTPSPSPSATATAEILTFSEIEQTILQPTCAVMFCHDSVSGSISGNLVLESAVAYDNLVRPGGIQPDNAAAKIDGLLRVDPNHPDNSFLMRKVCRAEFGTELCPFTLPRQYGSPMPLVGGKLNAEQIMGIRDWILRGAPDD